MDTCDIDPFVLGTGILRALIRRIMQGLNIPRIAPDRTDLRQNERLAYSTSNP